MKIVLESNGILDSYMDKWHDLIGKRDKAFRSSSKNELTKQINCVETKVKVQIKSLTKDFLRQFGMTYDDIDGDVSWRVDTVYIKPEISSGKLKQMYQVHASFDFKDKE